MTGLTIIVPTFNEAENVAELVQRIETVVLGDARIDPTLTEIVFVDDSTDDTQGEVRRAAATAQLSVSCIHREKPDGGLGGAVLLGAQRAKYDMCLVMDGDLQHPPERIPDLYERLVQGDVDVVVASRYRGGGSTGGLSGSVRRLVSLGSTLLVKAMFPIYLHDCSDPMTGFFAFGRRRVNLERLKPQGFKILLEMLARERLSIAEIPFEFAQRFAGESKASVRQGMSFIQQLLQLRFGRMGGFALVGAVGAIVNILIVWLLTRLGVGVLPATLIAAEVTIIGNFLVQDRFVFGDLRAHTRGFWSRFIRSFSFNNVEGILRVGIVVFVVGQRWMGPTLATAILLLFAFMVRYAFHALVVYAPRKA